MKSIESVIPHNKIPAGGTRVGTLLPQTGINHGYCYFYLTVTFTVFPAPLTA